LPDLVGATEEDAVAQLEALGLRAEVEEGGSLLDALLGGDWIVCQTRPPAGSGVRRGTSVHVTVAKGC
jgi:beta-lactam-binding protein with PASTA domain